MKILGGILVGLVVMAMTLWVVGMLYFSPLLPEPARAIAAGGFAVLTVLAFLFLPRRGRALLGFVVVFAILVVLFFRIPASNDRDWQPEVAMTPYATINGDMITIHNVRNFDYQTETEFTPHWETRTYDLKKLDAVDAFAVYWAGKAIAHIMVSFDFGGKDHLAGCIIHQGDPGGFAARIKLKP